MIAGAYVDQVKGQDAASWVEAVDGSVYAWVIDGASPLVPDLAKETSGLVRRLSEALTEHGKHAPGVRELAVASIADANTQSSPATATLSLASAGPTHTEVLVLGDSPAWTPLGVQVAAEFDQQEEALLTQVTSLIAEGANVDEAYAAMDPHLREYRATRNHPGGSGWVVGHVPAHQGDPAATIVENAYVERINAALPVLLSTDGAFRIVDWGLEQTAAELHRKCVNGEAGTALRQLRRLEAQDRRRERFPRFSIHDDASFAWTLPGDA